MTAILENQRLLHEELERLEQGVADRLAEEPRNVRPRPLFHVREQNIDYADS